jgi:hypothetical protein
MRVRIEVMSANDVSGMVHPDAIRQGWEAGWPTRSIAASIAAQTARSAGHFSSKLRTKFSGRSNSDPEPSSSNCSFAAQAVTPLIWESWRALR